MGNVGTWQINGVWPPRVGLLLLALRKNGTIGSALVTLHSGPWRWQKCEDGTGPKVPDYLVSETISESQEKKKQKCPFWQRKNSLLMKLVHFVTFYLCVCSDICVQFDLSFLFIHFINIYFWFIQSFIKCVFGKILIQNIFVQLTHIHAQILQRLRKTVKKTYSGRKWSPVMARGDLAHS